MSAAPPPQPTKPELERDPLLLDQLYGVGPNKPLGYLPVRTIVELCGKEVETVRAASEEQGHSTLLADEAETNVFSGALYTYDEDALRALLDKNTDLLRDRNWPTEPLAFIRQIGRVIVDVTRDPALYTLIAWAYDDPRPEYQRPDHGQEAPILEQPRVPYPGNS